MPLGVNIISTLTLQIPGSEGHAPVTPIFFLSSNIKVYVNLLNGKIPAGPAQAAGYIMTLKL